MAGRRESRGSTAIVEPSFTRPSDCLRAAVWGALSRQFRLTPRQLEVLELDADGKSNEEIAAQLVIELRTVEDHLSKIYRAMDSHERSDVVAWCLRLLYQAIDALGLHQPPHQPAEHGQ